MIATENWIRKQFGFLWNCPYQHVVVSLPYELRGIAKGARYQMLNAMTRIAAEVMMEWATKRGFQLGIVSFFHSFGEKLQFHPHYHMIVTSGGLTPEHLWKTEKSAFPGAHLMEQYRARMMEFTRELVNSNQVNSPVAKEGLLKQISMAFKHWQFYVEKITYNEKHLLLYITRYVKRMIMSEKKIISWNSENVTFMTKSGKVLEYEITRFIHCITQHIPDKQFRLVRYYGFYANACRKIYRSAKHWWVPLQKAVEKSTWRDRQWQRSRHDPMVCKKCKVSLVLVAVSYGKKWVYWTWNQLLEANGLPQRLTLRLEDG